MSVRIEHIDVALTDPVLKRTSERVVRAFETAHQKIRAAGLTKVIANARIRAYTRYHIASVPMAYEFKQDKIDVYLENIVRTSYDLVEVAIHEYGHRYWNKFVAAGGKRTWQSKYIQVSPATVRVINQQAWSKNFRAYDSFINSFRDNYTRLVALHFCNALQANRVPASLLRTIDFTKHPATSQMATGKKKFSLTPLLSIYAQKDQYEDFAETFRSYVVTRGKFTDVSDPRGREMLNAIFTRVIS